MLLSTLQVTFKSYFDRQPKKEEKIEKEEMELEIVMRKICKSLQKSTVLIEIEYLSNRVTFNMSRQSGLDTGHCHDIVTAGLEMNGLIEWSRCVFSC